MTWLIDALKRPAVQKALIALAAALLGVPALDALLDGQLGVLLGVAAPCSITMRMVRPPPAARRVARRAGARRVLVRRATLPRAAGGGRTIRIVIEQGAANSVARPPLGMVQAQAPRKATF